MRTISELAKSIKEIYEDVLILQNSMEKKGDEIDYQRINIIASKNPLKNHYISKLDEYTQKIYLTYLANIINITKNQKTKYSQIQFFSRLISSIDNKSFDTKEILITSLTNKMDLLEFVKCISDKLLDIFIVDSLILTYINSDAESEVLEYVSEIISLFNIKVEKFKELLKLVKAILIKDDDGIVSHSKVSDLNLFLCYMKNPYNGVIVYSLEDAIKEESEEITILNTKIKNVKEVIDLDKFVANKIVFRNCIIEDINGIESQNKIVEIHNTIFKNIHSPIKINSGFMGTTYKEFQRNFGLLDIQNCYIDNCIFENCSVSKELIKIKKGSIFNSQIIECKGIDVNSETFLIDTSYTEIKNLIIKNCKIETNNNSRNRTSLGIISILYGRIDNCKIHNCTAKAISSYGKYAEYRSYIIKAENSKVNSCTFEQCDCIQGDTYKATIHNYIIGLLDSSNSNCKFVECCSYNYRYGDRGSNTHVGNI